VDALIQIRKEIQEVKDGKVAVKDSVLRNAPHTQGVVMADKWDRKYSREQAAYPLPYLRRNKFWPTVGRVNDVFGASQPLCIYVVCSKFMCVFIFLIGDTNLVTKCPDYKIYGKVSAGAGFFSFLLQATNYLNFLILTGLLVDLLKCWFLHLEIKNPIVPKPSIHKMKQNYCCGNTPVGT
jgi:hypothetical protein